MPSIRNASLAPLAALALFAGSLAGAAPTYRITALGQVPGYQFHAPVSLNDHGDVAGYAMDGNGIQPFIRPAGGTMTAIGGPEGCKFIHVGRLNNRGELAAACTSPAPAPRHTALVLSLDAPPTVVPRAGSGFRLFPMDIDDTGQVVGHATRVAEPIVSMGFAWKPGAPRSRLAGERFDGFGPHTVNELGWVAASAFLPAHPGVTRAVIAARDGQWRNLGTLPNGGAGGGYSEATEINNLNQACGRSSAGDAGVGEPFFWSEAAGMQKISPWVDEAGRCAGLNDAGEAVLRMDFRFSLYWSAADGALDLKSLIDPADPLLPAYGRIDPYAINQGGQVLVLASPTDGRFEQDLLLLTPQGRGLTPAAAP